MNGITDAGTPTACAGEKKSKHKHKDKKRHRSRDADAEGGRGKRSRRGGDELAADEHKTIRSHRSSSRRDAPEGAERCCAHVLGKCTHCATASDTFQGLEALRERLGPRLRLLNACTRCP